MRDRFLEPEEDIEATRFQERLDEHVDEVINIFMDSYEELLEEIISEEISMQEVSNYSTLLLEAVRDNIHISYYK